MATKCNIKTRQTPNPSVMNNNLNKYQLTKEVIVKTNFLKRLQIIFCVTNDIIMKTLENFVPLSYIKAINTLAHNLPNDEMTLHTTA